MKSKNIGKPKNEGKKIHQTSDEKIGGGSSNKTGFGNGINSVSPDRDV